MPSIDDKNETEDDEMDQDSCESDNKSEDDEFDSGSGSDVDGSSDIDESECDRRRLECCTDMTELERQFLELKEQLYVERKQQVEAKLAEVRAGTAAEYLTPLQQLSENMQIRTQVASVLKDLKLQNLANKRDAEEQAAHQNFESEKAILYDNVKNELQDRIRRLEEDRHNIDITSDLWNESQNKNKRKRTSFSTPERRRKAVQVTGPYVVYMLKDNDIVDDWSAIKKAIKQTEKAEKKKKEVFKSEKHPYSARYEDGKLFYENEWYCRGNHIIIDNKEENNIHVTITAINTTEVWIKRTDGTKSKLYINKLQLGKYQIRHVPY